MHLHLFTKSGILAKMGLQDTIDTRSKKGPYSNLSDALNQISERTNLVVAYDKVRNYGVKPAYVGKTFYVSSIAHEFNSLRQHGQPNAYEIIQSKRLAKFYLDIETSIDSEPLYDESVAFIAGKEIRRMLFDFLKLSFPQLTSDITNILVSHACNEKKFSLHIVCKDYIMDTAQVSAAVLAAEFAAYLPSAVRDISEAEMDEERARLFLKKYSSKLVDLGVYSNNQQYRMLGCGKLKIRSLADGSIERQCVRPLRMLGDAVDFNTENWNFSAVVPTMIIWTDMLVQFIGAESFSCNNGSGFHCRPNAFHAVSVLTKYKEWYVPRREQGNWDYESFDSDVPEDMLNVDGRHHVGVTSSTTLVLDEQMIRERRSTRGLLQVLEDLSHRQRRVPGVEATTTLLDDDEQILDEFGRGKSVRSIRDHDVVYCKSCETRCETVPGIAGQYDSIRLHAIGTPSARVRLMKSGQLSIKCFNEHCSAFFVILPTTDALGFCAESKEIVHLQGKYINEGSAKDIELGEVGKRLIVVDAPMGSGKTELAQNFIKELGAHSSILSITFRRSLARNLSVRWGLTCYLDMEYITELDGKLNRFIVCLDSIYKVPDRTYDCIIIDEATFVRHHFTSSTLMGNPNVVECISRFKSLLRRCGRLIIMQYRVTDACIDFYMEEARVKESQVSRYKVNRPPSLLPTRWTQNSAQLTAHIVNNYIHNYDVTDLRSKKPMVIFTTKQIFGEFLQYLLRSVANRLFDPRAQDRIRFIWSGNQDQDWAKDFLSQPNQFSQDCDVLILTSICQAGFSIETWFSICYDFLFCGILTSRETLQLVSRVRTYGNPSLSTPRYTFIESGKANTFVANEGYIKLALDKTTGLVGLSQVTTFLNGIMASVLSEKSDSYNRYSWLWSREYKMAHVAYVPLEGTGHGDFTDEQVHQKLRDFSRLSSNGIVSYLELNNEEDRQRLLDDGEYKMVYELLKDQYARSKEIMDFQYDVGRGQLSQGRLKNTLLSDTLFQREYVRIFSADRAKNGRSVMTALNPVYNFLALLDLLLTKEKFMPDPVSSLWVTRKKILRMSFSNKAQVADLCEIVLEVLDLLDALVGIYMPTNNEVSVCPFHLGKFTRKFPKPDSAEGEVLRKDILTIFRKHRSYFVSKGTSDVEKWDSDPKKYPYKQLLRTIFGKVGLSLSTKDNQGLPSWEVDKLCNIYIMSLFLIPSAKMDNYACIMSKELDEKCKMHLSILPKNTDARTSV